LGSLEGLEKGLQRLEKELELEQQAAVSSPNEAGLLYGSYASSVIQQRDHINAGISSMEEQVLEARARLDISYRELKKFEITQEARDFKTAQEVGRQESNEMDELALQVHRSKSD
jgi:flagellar FliJ protein